MRAHEYPSFDVKSNQRIQILPASGVLHSNAETKGDGMLVEVLRHPALESPEHYRREYSLTLALAPFAAEWQGEGGRFRRGRFAAGAFHLLPPRMPLRYVTFAQAEIMQIVIPPAFFARVAHEDGAVQAVALTPCYLWEDDRVHGIALALRAELAAGSPGGRLFSDALMVALAVHLLRHHTDAPPRLMADIRGGLSTNVLNRVIEYIHAHHAEKLSLAALAGIAGLSQHYFARLFRQSTGMTPHHYLVRCRVERAQALLREGALPIHYIAQAVGFTDQSHLTRHFTRLIGTTPARFAKR